MRRVILPGTDLCVSRFVFGTASLHHLGRRSTQAGQLEAAAAAGFTHFDTAPLYGFGGAEKLLGEVFGAEPAITFTTKVGLYPPGRGDQGRASMLMRKVGGRLWPALSRAVADFAVKRARYSLQESLRRLRRGNVDLLLIHDPPLGLLQTDEWLRWREAEAERVRHVGIAGPAELVAPFLQAGDGLGQVIQVSDSLDNCDADIVHRADRPMQLTYGYFRSSAEPRSGSEVLAGALARNRTGAIIVSTRSQARLMEFAKAAAGEDLC